MPNASSGVENICAGPLPTQAIDCRVNGIDYLLMRLSYAHPDKMPAELVATMLVENSASINRQRLVEQSIEQARRERSRIDELARIEAENTSAERKRSARKVAAQAIKKRFPDLNKIASGVCGFYRVEFEGICSNTRAQTISIPRQVFCYLARELTGHSISYPDIGQFIGGKDHASVIKAHKQIASQVESSPDFAMEISHIIDHIEKYSEAA